MKTIMDFIKFEIFTKFLYTTTLKFRRLIRKQSTFKICPKKTG